MVYGKHASMLSEIHTCGEVSESCYDDYDFPLYMDHAGKLWRLKSSADYMTRSKELSMLRKKRT